MHLASCTWQRCTLVQSPNLGVIRRCVCIKMQAVLRLLAKDTEASRCREKSGKHHQQSQIVDSPVSLKSRERSKGVSSSNSNRRHDQGFRNRLLTQRRVGAVPRVGRNCRHRGRADHFRHLARDRLAQAHGTGGDGGARGRAGRLAGQVRVSLLCLPKTSSGAMRRGACTRGSPEGASDRENRVGLLWMRTCGSRVAKQDCKLVAERNDLELQIRAAAKPTSEP